MPTKATVIGTGAMGTIVAQLLASRGTNVALLARTTERVQMLVTERENRRHLPGLRLDERIRPTADSERAFAHTELIVSAVPCQYLSAMAKEYAALVRSDIPVCSVTKGLELETALRPSEILERYWGQNPIAVLSGPSIAPELARCLPATVVVACPDQAVATLIQDVMSTTWFRIYTNQDLLGVELAGAMKNVIALAAGILDGLRAGYNAKSSLLTRGVVEIARLGVACGALAETFQGLAGVGDLVTTCFSPVGRNRSAGERIGSGVPAEQVQRESTSVIEGIPTARAVLQLAERWGVEMPITEAVNRVLFEGQQPLEAITQLMNRPPKPE
jgi:glycerol-3-phosphate dehydrogenase (NAD(P)+)